MFDVGFSEIFLLSLIGLLVLGPERLPGVARTIGGFVRKARTSWNSLRKTIEAEMAEADLATPIKKAREELQQIGKELQDAPAFTVKNRQSNTTASDAKPGSGAKADPVAKSTDEKGAND
jgi:sec-independent protein translocase protein TatB